MIIVNIRFGLLLFSKYAILTLALVLLLKSFNFFHLQLYFLFLLEALVQVLLFGDSVTSHLPLVLDHTLPFQCVQ